jgi:ankyrin repeat protein
MEKSFHLIKYLNFHPKVDHFNYNFFDEDGLRSHVLNCVGALVYFQKKFEKLKDCNDNVGYAKRRVFWQSLFQFASFAENELVVNEALDTVFESFPRDSKDGKSWLPLHFAVSLEQSNPADISSILLSNTNSIKMGSDCRLINPCHLLAMSKSQNLKVLHQFQMYNYRMGSSITANGCTPLHIAACDSNNISFVEELIRIHPPALRMLNTSGETPFEMVFANTNCMAPKILKKFLQIDPGLLRIRNEVLNNELPIHRCVEQGDNPNALEFLSILLEANHDLANAPNSEGLLPIHFAARYSTVEVMKVLYDYSEASFSELVPFYGSVAHQAVNGHKLDILKYIHGINPELLCMVDNDGRTPLLDAVSNPKSNCEFIKAVYALAPTAISKVLSLE